MGRDQWGTESETPPAAHRPLEPNLLLSPDGSTVVTIGRNPLDDKGTRSCSGTPPTGKERASIKTTLLDRWLGVSDFSFSEDGKVFAFRTADSVDVYDVATRVKRVSLKLLLHAHARKPPRASSHLAPSPRTCYSRRMAGWSSPAVGTARSASKSRKIERVVKLPLPRNNDPKARNSYSAPISFGREDAGAHRNR